MNLTLTVANITPVPKNWRKSLILNQVWFADRSSAGADCKKRRRMRRRFAASQSRRRASSSFSRVASRNASRR